MPKTRTRHGPLGHRLLVFLLVSTLTILLVWLLGFVLSDIGRLEGPSFQTLSEQVVSPAEVESLRALEKDRKQLARQISDQEHIQQILRKSTESSRATMDQFMSVHRLQLEKGVSATGEEQAALAESQQSFLTNQRKFQDANQTIDELSQRARELETRIRDLTETHEKRREPASEAYEEAVQRHEIKIAIYKLAFLIPIFLIAALLVLKKRESAYAPIVYAVLVASAWKVGSVIHEHFPREVFKYVAIGTAIVVVLVALVFLIRLVVAPRRDWLLKQYREAYRRHRCPVCSDPIQRGPLRHATWTRKGPVVPAPVHESSEPGEPYTCASCGTPLFAKCDNCQSVRHELLPFCESCGAEKKIDGLR